MIKYTEKLLNLSDFNYHSDTLIETGSSMGDGIQRALIAGFTIVRSVELDAFAYAHCVSRFVNFHPTREASVKVHLYHGKSIDRLSEMLNASAGPCVVVLDAHPAGPHTAGHDDLMKKGKLSEFNQHNIIMNELKIILNHRKDHLIIIDDQQHGDPHDETHMYCNYISDYVDYDFFLYDEKLSKESPRSVGKLLVCVPKEKK